MGYLSISLNHLLLSLSMLYSSQHMSFTSFFRFIPKHFILFDVILKVIVFYFPFPFIVSIKKCNRFLYVNLISCYIAEFDFQF